MFFLVRPFSIAIAIAIAASSVPTILSSFFCQRLRRLSLAPLLPQQALAVILLQLAPFIALFVTPPVQ